MTLRRTPMTGRRAPLERRKGLDTSGGALRRRAPLPREGRGLADVPAGYRPAGAREVAIPQAARDAVAARSAGRCEVALVDTCDGAPATDVHHRKRRREGGHGVPNLLDLCRPCHSWAHAHPNVARLVGVIVSVYEDPATVPVLVRSRLTGGPASVLLTAAGTYDTQAAE